MFRIGHHMARAKQFHWIFVALLLALAFSGVIASQHDPAPKPKPNPEPNEISSSESKTLAGRRAGVSSLDNTSVEAQAAAAEIEKAKNAALESLGSLFVKIPAGKFLMGDKDTGPPHLAYISRSFEMSKYEVTQALWEAVMGNNPSYFKGANLPVERVSWDDVKAFISALNARNDGYVYRLPTEAEWEYACRAGTTGDYGGTGNLHEMGWCGGATRGVTHPVGQKKPNRWGLYDMHGNVWEWVHDWYKSYSEETETDPQGPDTGSYRVYRGGGWGGSDMYCRSSFRFSESPSFRDNALGFRLVRQPK